MSKKILVVEDNLRLSKFLTKKLDKKGFEVIVAHDGKEGLSAIEKKMPDLVLLDLVMPVMDGLEMLKELRTKSDVPVIVLTNLSDEHNIKELIDAGANMYLVKVNYSLDEIMEQVNKVLK